MMYARALAKAQSSVSALQNHALRDARHRAEMAELEARRKDAELRADVADRMKTSDYLQNIERLMAHCNSPAACREQTEFLQAQSEATAAAIQVVDGIGKMTEADARLKEASARAKIAEAIRKCVEEVCYEEARARVEANYAKERARMEARLAEVQAEVAEAKLRNERAEDALAAYRAESRAKRRRVDSEASSYAFSIPARRDLEL